MARLGKSSSRSMKGTSNSRLTRAPTSVPYQSMLHQSSKISTSHSQTFWTQKADVTGDWEILSHNSTWSPVVSEDIKFVVSNLEDLLLGCGASTEVGHVKIMHAVWPNHCRVSPETPRAFQWNGIMNAISSLLIIPHQF